MPLDRGLIADIDAEPPCFDPGEAFEHVRRLSYPRRVGSRSAVRAAGYVRREFEAQGLLWRRERFEVPLLVREMTMHGLLGLALVSLLAGAAVASTSRLAAASCWVASALLTLAPWRVGGRLDLLGPKRFLSRTENIVASDASEAFRHSPCRVVFLAHHDTKSQLVPTGVRVALVGIAVAISVVLALAAGAELIAGWIWGTQVPGMALGLGGGFVGWGLVGAGGLGLLVLAANWTGNRSPGALDNASGIGTLLELARSWRPRAEAAIEGVWVATGSEETGLDGAIDFLAQHEDWLREKPTLLVNLDSVGAGERIYLAGEPGALALAKDTADRLGLGWAVLRVAGAGMDHQPFASRGFAAVSLLGDVVGRSLDLHSPRDTIDRVDPEALRRAGVLAAHLAWAWAERHAAISRETQPMEESQPVVVG